MDIRQLKYFVAIVDCGSLSKAAKRLCVAQPSLSQQVANLEGELKSQLLLRSHQGVQPTEAGRALYLRARDVLRQVEEIPLAVQVKGTESGQVAIGLPTSVAVVFALPLYDYVRRHYPGIRLHIVEGMSGYLAELMANGRLDMAILFREAETRGIAVRPLFEENLYAFGDIEGIDAGADVPLRRLADVPLVLPSAANGLRLLIERAFAREGIEPRVVADIDSLPTMLAIARQGGGVTLVSSDAFGHSADQHLIHRLVEPEISRAVALCVPNALPTSAASLAIQKVVEQLVAELVESGVWAGVLPGRSSPRARR
ncbi:LysR family nitrogen assimilation transcriptional regulator [Paraburkholderia tropica]|uniref:LysR substrate-binding domain-containing protein n=1 Tax=Paraburkholderia tropica TaxID=92647 RepID=UPI001CAD07B5|nr:LysR substrate-binding domain-containing protein [Paraburkholderia tropica]CAG9192500.1 LysR family nitrogen assimilation transcriptional regulator [Paraburkholderia tropica]